MGCAHAEEPGLLWKRALLWAFALVVGCFLTETIVSQMVASAIDDAATRIVTDYSPSVVALASARTELHRMQDFLSDYVAGGGDDPDRERVAASMVDLDRAVDTYLKLPTSPGSASCGAAPPATSSTCARPPTDRSPRSSAVTPTARSAGAERVRAAVDRASADI